MFTSIRLTCVNVTRSNRFTIRSRHKNIEKSVDKPPPKAATDVLKYLDKTPEYSDIKNKMPPSLLRKYKTPESMYLINKKTAKTIVKTIQSNLDKIAPIVEVNPGFGFITSKLLQDQPNHIYLYEASINFSKQLADLQTQYPDRITLKTGDFFGMWKLAFQDKIDGGNRIQDLLGDLASEDKNRSVKIIGSMPSLSFVKHLINNIVFHNSNNQLGRPDLFIALPAHHYENLVETKKAKSTASLFQLLFDYKKLATVPKIHFLPWTLEYSKKGSVMDEYSMYLVNISQKENLPCHPDYLPLLWYFFKPQVFSKSTRIIPMLEQWIPGCGVWLITGQDPPDTNKELSPNENDEQLPHMTIFTEFGDLNLNQKITLFKKFISWPEFDQCQFRVTMLNNLPRSVTQLESDKERIIHIDDEEHSDNENEGVEFEK